MQYTLGQARKRLAASSHAYGADDLRESINAAIQALSTMTGWECLRKVLRFTSAGPGFVLPQGCAGLVRVCVNGSPVTVRGQDFRFVQSGPGDMARPPKGFVRVRPENVYDIGMKPVMVEPFGVFRVMAVADGSVQQPDVIVKGYDHTGTMRTLGVRPAVEGTGLPDVEPNDQLLQTIEEVTIHSDATEYVHLFAEDMATGLRYRIGDYNPEVKAPQFRHYELVGVPMGCPVEILAEARVDPIPLVKDSDILPFPSIEPIEWMIRADWQMKAGEVSAAQKYQDMAAKWLRAQEVTDDTIQTQVVINSVFEGSPGEISMESFNI